MENLKPCPFCGGKAETDTMRGFRNISTGGIEDQLAIYCLECEADMSICLSDDPYAEIDQLIEKWNARAYEWQPMETAPKGGGAELCSDPNYVEPPIILLCFEGGFSVAYWDWAYAEGGYYCEDGVAWIEPCSAEQLNHHYGNPTGWKYLLNVKKG